MRPLNIRLTGKSVRAQRGLARNLPGSEATAGCVPKGFIRLKRLLDSKNININFVLAIFI